MFTPQLFVTSTLLPLALLLLLVGGYLLEGRLWRRNGARLALLEPPGGPS